MTAESWPRVDWSGKGESRSAGFQRTVGVLLWLSTQTPRAGVSSGVAAVQEQKPIVGFSGPLHPAGPSAVREGSGTHVGFRGITVVIWKGQSRTRS